MLKKIIIIFVMLGLVAGCYQNVKKVKPDQTAIFVAKLHRFVMKMPKKSLDDFVLVIPTGDLFNKDSANFSLHGSEIIKDVSMLMKHYEIIDLKVISYRHVASFDNTSVNMSLAKEQARRISEYFWESKIDVRMNYYDGYLKSIPQNHELWQINFLSKKEKDLIKIRFQVVNKNCA